MLRSIATVTHMNKEMHERIFLHRWSSVNAKRAEPGTTRIARELQQEWTAS